MRTIFLSILACGLACPAPAQAQSTDAFKAWEALTNKPVVPCRLKPYWFPWDTFPEIAKKSQEESERVPYFGFNGTPEACQQSGPFRLKALLNDRLHFPPSDDVWYVQNITKIIPPKCNVVAYPCAVRTVRICSTKYVWPDDLRRPGTRQPLARTGPFGGPLGRGGCEKLWFEEYKL